MKVIDTTQMSIVFEKVPSKCDFDLHYCGTTFQYHFINMHFVGNVVFCRVETFKIYSGPFIMT